MRKQYRYVLLDLYEGDIDIVCVVADKNALKKEYNKRWNDTDGECDLMSFPIITHAQRKTFKEYYRYMCEMWGA